jgi:hypothetical protein
MSLGKSWALINSCSLFQKLALCVAITGIVSEGIQDLLVQYLQLVVGFNTADQALLYTIIGAANLVVQVRRIVELSSLLGGCNCDSHRSSRQRSSGNCHSLCNSYQSSSSASSGRGLEVVHGCRPSQAAHSCVARRRSPYKCRRTHSMALLGHQL